MSNAKGKDNTNDNGVESMLARVLDKALGHTDPGLSQNELAARVKKIKETKRPEPENPVAPGYAIISDYDGAGRKRVPAFMVMAHGSVMKPMHSMMGRATTGALYDKIKHREIVVEQFTPYPQGHLLRGHGRYFPHDSYINVGGTFFSPRHVPRPPKDAA